MLPITIDVHVVDAVERHVTASSDDRALLYHVAADCPWASLREIARAALYAATDASREDVWISARLYHFAVKVRKAA